MPSCPSSDNSTGLAGHVLASKSGRGKRLLVFGYLDTVFPPNSLFQRYRRGDNRRSGPDVTDMKGGQMVMLYPLKALDAKGLQEDLTVAVKLNSNEKTGKLSSRKNHEYQVALHDYALVYEVTGTNNLMRVRKGLGYARYVVNGKA